MEIIIGMVLILLVMRFIWYPIRSARDFGAEKKQNEYLSETITAQRETIHQLQQLLEP